MKFKWTLTVVTTLIVGVSIGRYFPMQEVKMPSTNTSDKAQPKTRKIKYWVAPMNPQYRRDKPGKSPMGMDLVPVYADESTEQDDKNVIKISSRVIDNLGVVTATATIKPISKEIDTVGYVTSNEDNIENVHSYIDGWVRNLQVTAVGDEVKKGQVLFELYSPSLINAQQEYVLALQNNNRQLIRAGRKKLITLGLTKQQIDTLQRTRNVKQQIPIYAKISGVLSKLNIRDGVYIKPDKELLVIEDLSSVWVKVEVYEQQSDWVKLHQTAIASFAGLPGRLWQGEVIYIYPTLDKKNHTLAVRLQFPNPNLTLKPDMYATVKILVPSDKKQLVVPSSAVIMTGRGSHVILSLGKGKYKPQAVTLGDESNDEVAILKGLSQGDKVVTSGQFLIDSESNLSAAFKRLDPHKKLVKHPNMKMDMTSSSNMGIVLAVNPKRKRVTLSHAPIQQLGMPEMVMELPVADNVSIENLKIGQKVHFKLKKIKGRHYLIVDIESVNNQ